MAVGHYPLKRNSKENEVIVTSSGQSVNLTVMLPILKLKCYCEGLSALEETKRL